MNRSSRAMPSATFELTGNTWYMPFGRSVSSKNSASRSEPIGVALAGLTTIGAPTASEGATLCATRFSGKLNGVMPSTGPIGKRRRMPKREPSACLGVQPHDLVVAVADHLGCPPERGDGACRLDGRPLQAACRPRRRSASRSPRWSRRGAWRCDRAPRLVPTPADAWTPRTSRRRPAMASSTSASVGTAISATTASSYGLRTSKVPSPVRHSPFTRNGLRLGHRRAISPFSMDVD